MYKNRLGNIIDRQLNYGRKQVGSFLSASGLKEGAVVLDLGAGHGDDLLFARSIHTKVDLHGIEIYDNYATELRNKNITVHALNIEQEKLPFEAEYVDVVIANQIMEHVKEIFWVLHEVSRTLKTGGSFIVGVPNLASLHNRLMLLFGRQPSIIQNNTAHVRGFTKRDLLNLINSCFPGGYKCKVFRGSNFYPFPDFMAKPLAKVFPNFAWSIFFLFEKIKPYEKQFLEFPVTNQLETNFYLGE